MSYNSNNNEDTGMGSSANPRFTTTTRTEVVREENMLDQSKDNANANMYGDNSNTMYGDSSKTGAYMDNKPKEEQGVFERTKNAIERGAQKAAHKMESWTESAKTSTGMGQQTRTDETTTAPDNTTYTSTNTNDRF